MKNYTLFCHGSVPVGMQKEDGYAYVTPALATIPQNVSVVFYIPPGTIFDAICGAMLHHRLRNNVSLNSERATLELMQAIRAEMNFVAKPKDYSARAHMFWVGQSTYKDYPKICNTRKNAEFVYNYNLKQKQDEHKLLKKVRWGLHEIGWGGAAVKPIGPGESSTLTEMLSAAATDADDEKAVVHCIFCRVEQFSDKASEDFADASMRTTTIQHVHIFDHPAK